MTDIREDLSNNSRLAYILVASGLQRYILHNSTALFGLITAYAADEDLFPREQSLEQYLSRVTQSSAMFPLHLSETLSRILINGQRPMHRKL